MDSEANFAGFYREARRDFIAACEQAGADVIRRVHPAKGPDGKPLFCDSAAFGPRDATRALLLIVEADGAVTAFLKRGFVLPKDTRLVAVHALDPFARAWGRPGVPADWPQQTLATVAAEDLSRVKKLTVLDTEASGVAAALLKALPKVEIRFQAVTAQEAGQAILAAMDGL
jgi:hypothetical protein